MGKDVVAKKRDESAPQTPVGMAGSHLNVPLNVAMERLGFRSQMRENGPIVFEQNQQPLTHRQKIIQAKGALDKSIVAIITSGQWESLEPNSGKCVPIGNHHLCVNYDEKMEAGYRTWEWHGHLTLYDDVECMYKPEYVYGNFFEPLDRDVTKLAANAMMERMMSSLFRPQGFF